MSINYHNFSAVRCVYIVEAIASYKQLYKEFLCQRGSPIAVPFVVEMVTVTAWVTSSAVAQINKTKFLPSVRSSLTVYDVLSNITRA